MKLTEIKNYNSTKICIEMKFQSQFSKIVKNFTEF